MSDSEHFKPEDQMTYLLLLLFYLKKFLGGAIFYFYFYILEHFCIYSYTVVTY